MGIRIATMKDGRVQLLHTASEAATPDDAEDGMLFMQEMIDLSKQQQQEGQWFSVLNCFMVHHTQAKVATCIKSTKGLKLWRTLMWSPCKFSWQFSKTLDLGEEDAHTM